MGRRRPTLASIGEFPFLDRILDELPPAAGDVRIGPGDDCAVVSGGRGPLLMTIDALVEGAHFEPGWLRPIEIGRKAYAVNASDIAAMGGAPRWALVAFHAPGSFPVADLRAIQRGIVEAAAETGATVVGGNLTSADRLVVTIALIGEAAAVPIRRAGARAGDEIFVTGTLGDSALGLRMLRGELPRRPAVLRRFVRPQPRLEAGQLLAKHRIASAAIDLSDGLLQDLGHVCDASGVGARIETDSLPLSSPYRRIAGDDPAVALSGGEDYELLFTVSPRNLRRLEQRCRRLPYPITRIGRIEAEPGIRLDGRRAKVAEGFDHFRAARERGGGSKT